MSTFINILFFPPTKLKCINKMFSANWCTFSVQGSKYGDWIDVQMGKKWKEKLESLLRVIKYFWSICPLRWKSHECKSVQNMINVLYEQSDLFQGDSIPIHRTWQLIEAGVMLKMM